MKSMMMTLPVLFAFTACAWAANEGGLSASDAQKEVQVAAHRFIERMAPDFGGSVYSPCATELQGDRLAVTCDGLANETIGGGGSVRIRFSCVGKFDQGHDGLFYQDGRVDCR